MAVHWLKTWPGYFQAIQRGDKTFEVRRNDRDFKEGDTLILQEWAPAKGSGSFTGRWASFKVGWILYGGDDEFGADALRPLYCVMSLVPHETLGPDRGPPLSPEAEADLTLLRKLTT